MRQGRRLLMTTTSGIDGWEVTDYLGPVSAQFVIGTGLFTDFFSSFTDFFGAQSRSYQKKLDRINEEALSLIEMKAVRDGADAVLGLRVDHDEVSGSGKSMLMVTASGTAVRARKLRGDSAAPEPSETDPGTVMAHELQNLLERRRLARLAEAGNLNWQDEDTWRFILDNEMDEIAGHVLRRVEGSLKTEHTEQGRRAVREKYKEYFLVLPSEIAKDHLYPCLESRDDLWGFAFRVIHDGHLFDPERVRAYLNGESDTARKRSVQLVMCDAPYYSVDDIEDLEALKESIRSQFQATPVYSKKGIFGEKEVWECSCGNETAASEENCSGCGLDRYGFGQNMLRPDRALALLNRKLEVLRSELQRA